jgi:hypothetical protein
MASVQVLQPGQQPADPANHIVLTEVVRPGRAQEYTVTVLIDGKPVSTAGPFARLDDALDQASADAERYALDPIYVLHEKA